MDRDAPEPSGPARWCDGWLHPVVLGLVLLFAAWIRLHDLGSNPPGLFRDELEKGYTALELATTTRHGFFEGSEFVVSGPMPLFIDVFGDKTSAIYQYLSAPVVGVFGLSATTTRLVAALSGLATVLLGYALGRMWLGRWAGVWVAAFLATMPQAIVFSRWAQQGVTAPMLALAGVLLFWMAFWREARERRGLAALSGLAMGLAFYAYDPVRPAVAAIVSALVAGIGWERVRDEWRLMGWFGGAFLAVAVPVTLYALGGEGSHRYARIGVFGEGLWAGLGLAARQYLEHFSGSFLFLSGDANPRHQLPVEKVGLVPLSAGVCYLATVVVAWRDALRGGDDAEARARRLLLVVWLMAAPVGAALTKGGIPHGLRSIMLVPVLGLLAAEFLAGARVWPRRWAWACGVGLGMLAVLHAGLAWRGVEAMRSSRPDAWQAGVVERIREAWSAAGPQGVVLSAEIPYAPYFALWAEKTDPDAFQDEGLGVLKTRVVPPGLSPRALPPGTLMVTPDPMHSPFATTDAPPVILEFTEKGFRLVGPRAAR